MEIIAIGGDGHVGYGGETGTRGEILRITRTEPTPCPCEAIFCKSDHAIPPFFIGIDDVLDVEILHASEQGEKLSIRFFMICTSR